MSVEFVEIAKDNYTDAVSFADVLFALKDSGECDNVAIEEQLKRYRYASLMKTAGFASFSDVRCEKNTLVLDGEVDKSAIVAELQAIGEQAPFDITALRKACKVGACAREMYNVAAMHITGRKKVWFDAKMNLCGTKDKLAMMCAHVLITGQNSVTFVGEHVVSATQLAYFEKLKNMTRVVIESAQSNPRLFWP